MHEIAQRFERRLGKEKRNWKRLKNYCYSFVVVLQHSCISILIQDFFIIVQDMLDMRNCFYKFILILY